MALPRQQRLRHAALRGYIAFVRARMKPAASGSLIEGCPICSGDNLACHPQSLTI
jgi:hypothetical protein